MAPIIQSDIFNESRRTGDPGIGAQNIQPAPAGRDVGHHGGPGGLIRHVQQGAAPILRTGLDRVTVHLEHDKVHAKDCEDCETNEGKIDVIRKNIPKIDDSYLKEDISTIDRQEALCEIMLSTLISGMTNVAAFTVDELGTPYVGLPKIENERVNLHDVGHNKGFGSLDALSIREAVRLQHMKLVDKIVTRLKNTPEINGKGSMFDNTIVFYFPDNGETHHSKGTEWPFIVMAGDNTPMNLGRRYIRLPKYGQEGHKTLGNMWTTVLNAYGNPVEHYGAPDTGLDKFGINQKGAIPQFLS